MNQAYSVSQATLYIKNLFTRDAVLARIVVEGEVSNCKYHSSGHIYFTLKDAGAQLKCVMFSSARLKGLDFRMGDGAKVQVLGRISVYERDGSYQMYADRIVMAGLGELYERYEQLRKRLSEEGLFDREHKKPIPMYPKRIGIVTAETGAALQDICNILHRRNPYVQPILSPAQVQGEGAADTIVRAIHRLERIGVDVIIVGRGGGSIEDLWAFNEEQVARAVYACEIPVISCVGHETDTTIIDFVSDLRAPTPSAAAELAVREAEELTGQLVDFHSELLGAMLDAIARKREALKYTERLLMFQRPTARLERRKEQRDALAKALSAAMTASLARAKHRLELYAARLDGVSPAKKLSGGYGYVTDASGHAITEAAKTKPGDRVHIFLRDGELRTEVKEIGLYDEQ